MREEKGEGTVSINRLRNLYHPNTNQTASDAAGIPDNVLSGEVGTHTNAATITNSGNSSVTLNADTTADPRATPANENSQDPSVSAQVLLNMLQPLLEVSRELNKTAINNLSSHSNNQKRNETI